MSIPFSLSLFVDSGSHIKFIRPSMDAAVRAALVPQTGADPNGVESSNFTSVADLQGTDGTLMGLSNPPSSGETPISVTTLRPSALNKIEGFLLRGERRQAYHYALDQKLWSHAMIIASGIDKEAWQEVVNEFLKTELGTQPPSMGPSNGRESLRVVYSLLSGQGAKAGNVIPEKTNFRKVNESFFFGKFINWYLRLVCQIPLLYYWPL